jgi:hypothetical protein
MRVAVERPAVQRFQALGEREQLVELALCEERADLAEPVAGRKLARIALEDGVELAEAPSRCDGIRTRGIVVDPPPERDREPVLVVRPGIDLFRRGCDRLALRGQELRQPHLFREPARRAQARERDRHACDDRRRRKVDQHVGQIAQHDRPVDRQAVAPSSVQCRRNLFHAQDATALAKLAQDGARRACRRPASQPSEGEQEGLKPVCNPLREGGNSFVRSHSHPIAAREGSFY